MAAQELISRVRTNLTRAPRLFAIVSAAYSGYLQFKFGDSGLARPVNGETFHIDPRLRARFPAVHDPEVADFLRAHIRPGMTCFNIGANVGIMTLQMARWTGQQGRVVSFEPNPYARQALSRHLEMNGLTDQVKIEPFAVSNKLGSFPMYVSGDDGMGRLGEANEALRHQAQTVEVPGTTIDHYCSSNDLWPDAIMMDIEGYEIEALEGARELIRRNKDLAIVAEFHPSVWIQTKPEIESLFRDLRIQPVALMSQNDVYAEHAAVYFRRVQ